MALEADMAKAIDAPLPAELLITIAAAHPYLYLNIYIVLGNHLRFRDPCWRIEEVLRHCQGSSHSRSAIGRPEERNRVLPLAAAPVELVPRLADAASPSGSIEQRAVGG